MKVFDIIFVLLCTASFAFAQPVARYRSFNDVDFIVTDPNPMNTRPVYNSAYPYKTNTFDWRANFFPYKTPNAACLSGVFGHYHSIESYFYGTVDNNPARSHENSDFQPIDGWELVRRDFGYYMLPGQMDDPIDAATLDDGVSIKMAYIVLYNRYTATLRVLACPDKDIFATNMTVELSFADLAPTKDNVNGLLGGITGIAHPLDQETQAGSMKMHAQHPDCSNFYLADFPMSYDPCACKTASNLRFRFAAEQNSTLSGHGRGLGVSMDLSNSPYAGAGANGAADIFFNGVYSDDNSSGSFVIEDAKRAYELYKEKTEQSGQDKLAGAYETIGKAAAFGAKYAALTGNEELAAGLELAAEANDFMSFALKEDKPAVAPVTVIETDFRFTGTINSVNDNTRQDAYFCSPGALGSESCTELGSATTTPHTYSYPTYNEIMGLFALKNTTFADYVIRTVTTRQGSDVHANEANAYFNISTIPDYFLNPASGVDLEKTKIRAALQITLTVPDLNGVAGDYISQFQLQNLRLLDSYIVPSSNPIQRTFVFTTPYLPPYCLTAITAGFNKTSQSTYNDWPQFLNAQFPEPGWNFGARLKFINHYVFKSLHGEEQRTSDQVLTYEVNLINKNPTHYYLTEFDNFSIRPLSNPYDLHLSTQSFIEPVYAWNNIYLEGDLTNPWHLSNPNLPYNFDLIAGHEIIGLPGSSVGPGLDLVINNYGPSGLGCPAYDGHVSDVISRKAFCDNQYLAYKCTSCTANREGEDEDIPTNSYNSITLSPNPAPLTSPLQVNLTGKDAAATFTLLNTLGEAVPFSVQGDGGSYQLRHQATAPGVYILSIATPQGIERRRVVLQ